MVPRAAVPLQVGFLKILHKYEITFLLPPSQQLGRDVCALPLPNPNLKVLGVTVVPEGKHSIPTTAACASLEPSPIPAHPWAQGDPQQTLGSENTSEIPSPLCLLTIISPQCHISVVLFPRFQATV